MADSVYTNSADSLIHGVNRLNINATTTVKSPELEGKPFRFRDLPRELRNEVYALCTRDDVKIPAGAAFSLQSSIGCFPSMLLVDRQFKQEYEEQILAYAEVQVEASGRLGLRKTSFTLPPGWPTRLCRRSKHLTMVFKQWEDCFLHSLQDLQQQVLTGDELLEHIKIAILAEVIPHFPNIKSLNFIVHAELSKWKAMGFFNLLPPLFLHDADPAPAIQSHPISFTKQLQLSSKLFTIAACPSSSPLRMICLPEHARETYGWINNWIVYRATAAVSEPSWHGLDLQTLSSGTYSWKDMLKHERKLQEDDEHWTYMMR